VRRGEVREGWGQRRQAAEEEEDEDEDEDADV
jgi:hypothetical protein